MRDEEFDYDYEDRISSPEYEPGDDADEGSLRPQRLSEYIGQEKAKETLKIAIDAAKMREESLDHVLLYGPTGLGKTALANIIAHELGVNIRMTSGQAIENPGDIVALLTNLEKNDVLFIDDIDRLPRTVEEILYPAMEDFAVDIIIGKGPSAQSVHLPLKKFTLVGATTRAGQLPKPLRDRFGIPMRLEPYTVEELGVIVRRSAEILKIDIDLDGSIEIASRSRGTPRISNRLLKRVRDYAQVRGNGHIDQKTAAAALAMTDVDEPGLGNIDRQMLEDIAAAVGEGSMTLEELVAAVLKKLLR